MEHRLSFRIWNKKRKKMYYVSSIDIEYNIINYLDDDGDYTSINIDKCCLLQSTGFCDKNDNYIYEGDIVHVVGDYGYNEMDNEPYHHNCIYEIKDIRELASEWGLMNAIDAEFDIEIIGNVYENKDLLCK